MELADTIDMMISEDYKLRFKAEYNQLDIRLKKLGNFISKIDTGLLDFEPACPRKILAKQLSSMQELKWIMEERARIEHIDLGIKDLT